MRIAHMPAFAVTLFAMAAALGAFADHGLIAAEAAAPAGGQCEVQSVDVLALEQAALDAEPGPRWTVDEHFRLTGEEAKHAVAFMISKGAPKGIVIADEIVVLRAQDEKGVYQNYEHVVLFSKGCKIGGGYISSSGVSQLLSPA